jgi:hypothetical protein
MKGEVWLKYLTNEEKDNFLRDLKAFRSGVVEYFLDREYVDLDDFIGSAFPWKDSPEGVDYWHMISKRKTLTVYKMDKFKFI